MSVGIDVVLVEKFTRALERTPLLSDRIFTEAELLTTSGNPRSAESLAARFAAKEAVAQALCMTTADFERAFHAFANKVKPVFRGD